MLCAEKRRNGYWVIILGCSMAALTVCHANECQPHTRERNGEGEKNLNNLKKWHGAHFLLLLIKGPTV
jgi:hypothetical protein